MPVYPHHAIPLPPLWGSQPIPQEQLNTTVNSTGILTSTAAKSITTTAMQGGPGAGHDLFLLLAVAGAGLLAAAGLLFILGTVKPGRLEGKSHASQAPRGAGSPYRYPGLKGELRALYLKLRRLAASRLGREPLSATVREIASFLDTSAARRFALLYEPRMYGRLEPTRDDIEVLRDLVERAGEAG